MQSKKMASYQQVADTVEYIEQNFDTEQVTYNGDCCWHSLRSIFCNPSRIIIDSNGSIKDIGKSQSIAIFSEENKHKITGGKRFEYYLDTGEVLLFSNNNEIFQEKIDVLILDSYHDFVFNERNKVFNKNNDGLFSIFPNKKIVYLLPYDEHVIECPFKRNTLLYKRKPLHEGIVIGSENKIIGLNQLIQFLKDHRLPYTKSYDDFSNRIKSVGYRSSQFDTLFKYLSVKFLFTSGFCSVERMSAIIAAKRNNIRTIEYQHGALGSEHNNIKFFTNNKDWLPDFFWVYSDLFKNKISKINNERFIVGSKLSLINSRADKYKRNKITIIESHSQQDILTFCKKIGKLVLKYTDGKFDVCLRLHPRSHHKIEELERRLTQIGVSVKIATLSPLKEILCSSAYIIAEESTVAYEASHYGAMPIIYGKEGCSLFIDEITKGLFLYANDLSDIKDILMSRKNYELIKSKKNNFFPKKKVAIKNIKKFMLFN
ncbi:MAG: hypothetical protein ACRDCY_14150 [Aeromonas veronii]